MMFHNCKVVLHIVLLPILTKLVLNGSIMMLSLLSVIKTINKFQGNRECKYIY